MAELLPSGIKIPAGTDLVTRANYIENLAAMDALVNEGGHDHSGVPGKGEKLTAGNILITDTGVHYAADNVEEALEEAAISKEDHEGRLVVLEDQVLEPDSNTIALDKSTKVLTVTDSYASPSDLVIGGETLYNAVTNGDFSGGTTGWVGNNATLLASNKILSCTGSGESVSPQATFQTNIVALNNKFKAKVRVRVTSASCLSIELLLRDAVSSVNQKFSVVNNPVQNHWYELDLLEIMTGVTANSNLRLILTHVYASTAIANGKVMEVDGNVGVFAIPVIGTPYALYSEAQMNGLVNKYIDKLQGAKAVTVGSRGRNKFDGKFVGKTYKEKLFNGSYDYLEFRVKPNTQYTLSFDVETVFIDDMYFVDSSGAFTAITRSTVGRKVGSRTSLSDGLLYIAIARSDSPFATPKSWYETYLTNWTLFEGVGTEYEPYQGSQAVISATRHKLPNLVEDEQRFVDGEWEFIKRTEEHVLTSAEFIFLQTSFTNVDMVAFLKPLDYIGKGNNSIDNAIYNGAIASSSFIDNVSQIGKLMVDVNLNEFYYVVAKGTYANLAAAQTALAGTKVVYQLATPLIIKEADFAQYGITVEGSLSSNLDYTEYFIADHDIMADVSIDYATNLAKSVEQLKDSSDGLRTAVDGKASKVQEPWITPTLLNGWITIAGTAFLPFGIYKDEFGEVHIRGALQSGTTTTGTVIFKLPVGYRPYKNISVITATTSDGITYTTKVLEIQENGDVLLRGAFSVYLYFSTLSFRVEE